MKQDNTSRDNKSVSIVIPAFNEEANISSVVSSLLERYPNYEILVIDDGSTDDTAKIARQLGAAVVAHRSNLGYGASWKTGVRSTKGEIVVFFDGDNQFDASDVEKLLTEIIESDADLVSGNRLSESHSPIVRRPGKLVLLWLANFLSQVNIPDANCGLRAYRRTTLLRYMHILPDGFSASMTSMILFCKRKYIVKFVPIVVRKRNGQSTVRIFRDGFNTILLALKLMALFDPLRIFIPISFVLGSVALVYSIIEVITKGLGFPVAGALLMSISMMCFLLGIISDQISALRMERFEAHDNRRQETDL